MADMNDKIALKPCPFCGGEAKHDRVPDDYPQGDAGGEFVRCLNCGASSALVFPQKDSAEGHLTYLWNRRT